MASTVATVKVAVQPWRLLRMTRAHFGKNCELLLAEQSTWQGQIARLSPLIGASPLAAAAIVAPVVLVLAGAAAVVLTLHRWLRILLVVA